MTAITSDAADAAHTLNDETRAAALWTFVHLKTPRFASADALQVVRELAPQPAEEVKSLAKRLRAALAKRGVLLKHTHALEAASKLAGYKGWHTGGSEAARKPLSLLFHAAQLNRELDSWDDAVDVISDYVLGVLEAKGLRTFRFEFAANSIGMQQPLLETHSSVGRRVPLMRIVWEEQDTSQMRAAVAAVERVRRRFEETEHAAVVDGLAAIQFCLQNPHPNAHEQDPLNSELVVTDGGTHEYSGEEVARGNEVQCWRELATLIKDNHGEPSAPMELEDADWLSHDTRKRYRWHLTTLRATGGAVPVVVTRDLTRDESARLLRRRNLTVRSGHYLVPEDTVRSLALFNSDRPDVDVNWSAVSAHLLSERLANDVVKQALQSESFGSTLSLRSFEALINALVADSPQSFVRTPERKELARLWDDELPRALVSRVETVEYLLPRGLDAERAGKVGALVDMFESSLRMDAHDDDAPINLVIPRHAPYLIHAGQGQELLDGLASMGLVAYGGLTTLARRMSREGKAGREWYVRAARALLLDVDYAASPSQGTKNAFSGSLNGGEEDSK